MKIQDLLASAEIRLAPFSDTAQLDAQVLLAHVIGKPRTWVAAHPELDMEEQHGKFNLALKKLEAGEPLPYVLGKWEFFGLEFDLTPDVLIPRPETELLVEKALACFLSSTWLRVADIGTGSGVIAISIAKHIPNARILATDISPAAIKVAKHNAEKHGVQGQIEFTECDLLPTLNVEHLTFNVICSNPPYIPSETLHKLPIFGREPTLALDGGADGLNVYRRIFQLAPDCLAPQGMMLLEIESTLGEAVTQLGREAFPHAKIQLHHDLSGRDRLIQINLIN